MSLQFKMLLDRGIGLFLIFWLNFAARTLGFLMRRNHDLKPQGDILIIKMLGGGSLVMAFPALLGIRRAYPHYKMRLFTTKAVRPFAETLGIFDAILIVDDSSFMGMVTSSLRCLKGCFASDTVIDLEIYSYLSTVISLFTCARNRLGFFFDESSFRQRLHTHRIFFHPSSPLYLHYDRMVELIGAEVASMPDCAAQIKSVVKIDAATLQSPRRVAIGCGCSDMSTERRLLPEQWAQNVFAPAPDSDREVIFLGAKDDRADADAVIQSVTTARAWTGPLKNLCGDLPLNDSLRALAGAEEFWGIDSSLIHYARLFGLRIKAFFGPARPDTRLRPINGLDETVYYRKTICSPCVHLVSTPPCHGDNICMKGLFDPPEKDDKKVRWIPVDTDFNVE